tara:strand:- start:1180 stop:1950 length:771 start_codon:yes stop_codon:yes gene_type:complete
MNPVIMGKIVYYILISVTLLIIYNFKNIWILIVLKILDYINIPLKLTKSINREIKKHLSNYFKLEKTEIVKNSIFILFPHGPTIFPAVLLPLLCDLEDEYSLIMVSKWIHLIPGSNMFTKFFANTITNEKGNLKLAIQQNTYPFIFYPGGIDECLHNNTYSTPKKYQNISVKMLNLLLNSKRNIHVVSIQNETECYYHYNFISKFYKWINKYVEVGTPIPLPSRTGRKLEIKVSPPINTKKLINIEQLKNLIYKNL